MNAPFSFIIFQICEFLKGGTEVWNAPQDVPYAYKGNQWVGYDNMKSFQIKVGKTPLLPIINSVFLMKSQVCRVNVGTVAKR